MKELNAIEGNNTEKCDTASAAFQSENNGCVDFVGSEDEIMEQIRQLVCMLPSNNEGDVYTDDCEDDLNRACESMENMKGDPRYLLSQISDNNVFFETKADYARNMVTGLIKLNGMTVGAVANCSEVYDAEGKKVESFDKSLTAQGCNKAAEFVQFCDAFSIPVLTITNVNGLKNCMCSEKKLAKALARMTYAFSNATCAKVNLITGEAYGSAYVFMNSKSVGADLVYAWSGAKIGAMDSTLAAKIMYPEAGADEIKQKAADYEKLQDSAASAAARGYVDRLLLRKPFISYLIGNALIVPICLSHMIDRHTEIRIKIDQNRDCSLRPHGRIDVISLIVRPRELVKRPRMTMPQPNQFQPFLINCSDLVNQVLDIRLIVFKICDFKNRIRTGVDGLHNIPCIPDHFAKE